MTRQLGIRATGLCIRLRIASLTADMSEAISDCRVENAVLTFGLGSDAFSLNAKTLPVMSNPLIVTALRERPSQPE